MKHRTLWLSLLAAGLALPAAALRAQDEPCPCRRPGIIGVAFEEDSTRRVVVITDVRRGSPAERAGVREGDVVVRLNGETATFDRFGRLPLDLQAGDTVRLRLRGGESGEREVVVVAQPRPWGPMVSGGSMDGPAFFEFKGDSLRMQELTFRLDSLHTRLRHLDPERMRIRIDTLTELLRDSLVTSRMFRLEDMARAQEMALREGEVVFQRLGEQPFLFEMGMRSGAGAELAPINEGLSRYFRVDEGALVLSVGENTPAARAGLQAGDVIVSVDGDEVEDPSDFRRHLMRDEDRRMEIGVVRQGRRQNLTLEWERPEPNRYRRAEPSRRTPQK